MKIKNYYLLVIVILLATSLDVMSQGDGFLIENGKRLFPIGSYYMPQDDKELKEMADAGFNLIRCNSKEALDRVHSFGLKGWLRVPLQHGVTDKFKERVNSVIDHPALAIWEGPDEIVWHFTASSRLYRESGVHEKRDAWKELTPNAVKYAEEQAGIIIPNMISAISYIRSIDPYNRQVWINEAGNSDTKYVRQYLDYIDITGCDRYPITKYRDTDDIKIRGNVNGIKRFTQRWMEVGKGKPVYMVLQAFSYPELSAERYQQRDHAFPSFDESRYMAYIAIAYGARGINYWGAHHLESDESEEFLHSLLALTSELDALQPFLTSPEEDHVKVKQIKKNVNIDPGASCIARRFGRDWLIVVINETGDYQHGVIVENLKHLNGMEMVELYGDKRVTVSNEEMVLRMKPYEVKVFATGKKWESQRIDGRNYVGQ